MLLTLLAFACSEPEAVALAPRWPRPGLEAILEVSARIDEEGRASAWSAGVWKEEPSASATVGACAVPPARSDVPGLAAVDLTAPVATRLQPGEGAGMQAAGPLHVRDARWAVGDVRLVAADGTGAVLEGALRFGDAASVDAITVGSGGRVLLRFVEQAETRVEIDLAAADGRTWRCAEAAPGLVVLPADLVDAAAGQVVVRAVHHTVVVAPNAALVHMRAVVEQALSLADPLASGERAPAPVRAAPVWAPRKVLRHRADLG